jgi:hypothetical protein
VTSAADTEVSAEFRACWALAASYIQRLGDRSLSWFKGSLYPPFFEHFSFRLGSQLFFVRLEDVEGRLKTPGSASSLFEIARECRGRPLIMPMKNIGGVWLPIVPGWGLLDAAAKAPVNPAALVTEEDIEMTPWELHDLAVHSVIASLGEKRLISFNNHPDTSPSVWYEGETGAEWVIVRWARFPQTGARLPANWAQILEAASARGLGAGFFAVAAFSGAGSEGGPSAEAPILRGGNILVSLTPMKPFSFGPALTLALGGAES